MPSDKPTALRLPPVLLAYVEALAQAEGRSRSDVIRRILEQHMLTRTGGATCRK